MRKMREFGSRGDISVIEKKISKITVEKYLEIISVLHGSGRTGRKFLELKADSF